VSTEKENLSIKPVTNKARFCG